MCHSRLGTDRRRTVFERKKRLWRKITSNISIPKFAIVIEGGNNKQTFLGHTRKSIYDPTAYATSNVDSVNNSRIGLRFLTLTCRIGVSIRRVYTKYVKFRLSLFFSFFIDNNIFYDNTHVRKCAVRKRMDGVSFEFFFLNPQTRVPAREHVHLQVYLLCFNV